MRLLNDVNEIWRRAQPCIESSLKPLLLPTSPFLDSNPWKFAFERPVLDVVFIMVGERWPRIPAYRPISASVRSPRIHSAEINTMLKAHKMTPQSITHKPSHAQR